MFQYLFLTSVPKRNVKNLMEVSEIPEFQRRIFRMMTQNSHSKSILSAITFPMTLPLDRTLYLSYFSRYSPSIIIERVAAVLTTFLVLATEPPNRFSKIFFYFIGVIIIYIFFFIDQHRCHNYRDICKKLSPTLENITLSAIIFEPLDRFCSSSNLTSLL